MRVVSDQFRAAILAGAKLITQVTATVPGYGEIALKHSPGMTIQSRADRGARTSVQGLTVTTIPRIQNLYELLDTAGTTFDITVGVDYGANRIETLPVFHGYAVQGVTRIVESGVQLTLADPWKWCDDVPFAGGFYVANPDTRANKIKAAFLEVLPNLEVAIRDDGGTTQQVDTWNGSRGAYINSLAVDGQLDVYFDGTPGIGQGRLIIAKTAVLAGTQPSATITTGQMGNIVAGSGERTRDFTEIVNAIAVTPGSSWQAWATQIVKLTDTNHPWHESKIGLRGKEISSSTAVDVPAARGIGNAELQKCLTRRETNTVTALADPSQEVGDVVYLAAVPTLTDPGFGQTRLVAGINLGPSAGTMQLDLTSGDLYGSDK